MEAEGLREYGNKEHIWSQKGETNTRMDTDA
jgi:hypothetical protein